MYLPCYFPVCGVGFVRYSVNELFVECICDVFCVHVCVVFECYGLVSCCVGRLCANPCIVLQ